MSAREWKVPGSAQPKPSQYRFDLDRALSAVMELSARVPSEAFTATTLGTERMGHCVLIRPGGICLTVGYLVTEADTIWLTTQDRRAIPADVLGYDQESGFGLIQALGRLDAEPLPLGRSDEAGVGDRVVVAGSGGRQRAVAARLVAKQEFAGYWEYVLDEALFTAPAHPHWGGTALLSDDGALIGIGSLQLQQEVRGSIENLNMSIPIDLLEPVLDDLLTLGRPRRPARPWLGLYATEIEDGIVVAGLADNGPADRHGIKTGDHILRVAEEEVTSLAELFRAVWRLGPAGVSVPLTLRRDQRVVDVRVTSTDRRTLLKRPVLH